MNRPDIAVRAVEVSHRYGERVALDHLSLEVPRGQVVGLLGPNGSGKSTLFRLVSTLVPLQSGRIEVLGLDVSRDPSAVRRNIGVVFQSPSLDRKLTVLENLRCQAVLYGIEGSDRERRIRELSEWMGVGSRLHERCEGLSGGLKRRVELAKGLLHRPPLMILDEPSSGLDPAARWEFWQALTNLKDQWGTTILLTTHLMDEADKCDALAIIDGGRLVAAGTPDALRRETGEMVLSVVTREPDRVSGVLTQRLGSECRVIGDVVRTVASESGISLGEVVELLGPMALSVTVGRPGLEDVFMRKTGRLFANQDG